MSAAREVGAPTKAGVFHTETRRQSLGEVARLPVLLPSQAEELRFFFDGYEGAAGLRSSWTSLANQALGGDRVPRTDREDEAMAELVDTRAIRRSRRVRAAIGRMCESGQGVAVTVLFKLYGPRSPGEARAEFGDVAGIIEFTRAVTEARRERAAQLGAERGEASAEAVTLTVEQIVAAFWYVVPEYEAAEKRARRLAAMPTAIEQERQNEERFWVNAGAVIRLEARIEATPEGDERERLVTRLISRRAALGRRLTVMPGRIGGHAERARAARAKADGIRAHLKALIAAEQRGLPMVVRRSTQRGADVEVTTADAVRWRLDYHGPKSEAGVPNKDAHTAWKASRKTFVDSVRRQAERLRLESVRAFLAAWEVA